jgi:hypothetical protein
MIPSMVDAKLRSWFWHRQGLDGSLAGTSPAEVLARTGWARSVGGIGPYATLWARAGTTREETDAAVAKLRIHELPSARGCTYVVPASDYALALTVGQGFSDEPEMKVARKLGVTDAEIEKLCAAVLKAVAKGPASPDEMREAVGSAARSLGEAGKKKGLTTTLPVALGKLQAKGEIRRVPVDGRLDQQRYRYALWRPNPLAKSKPSKEDAYTELARRFFEWTGPATPAEFQWFSGLGVKAAKAAMGPLPLVTAPEYPDRLILKRDVDALRAYAPPKKPQYALVSGLDGLFLLRRSLEGLVDPKDAKRKVFGDKGLQPLGLLSDLPSHAIVDRGRVVGLWEYDPAAGSIVWTSFVEKDKALSQAVERTEAYVRDELGDARSFSLDSPKSRAPRIEAIRKAV